jgi:hypothetical protein
VNQFELEALTNKFPEIKEPLFSVLNLDPAHCEAIRIEKITPQLLDQTPFLFEQTGSCVEICKEERGILIYRDGKNQEVKLSHEYHSHYAHTEPSFEPGTSVGETLLSIEDLSTIKLILWVEKGYKIENHRSTKDWILSVFLLPEDFTVDGWRESKKQTAATLLQDQIDSALQASTDSDAQ